MSEYKQTQKALKGPDEFQVKVMSGLDYLVKYKLWIAATVGAMALVVAGSWGYQRLQEQRADKRAEGLVAADLAYQGELEKIGKERDAINKQIEVARAGLDPKESDPTKIAMIEAMTKDLEAKAKALKPEHKDSMEKFRKAFEELRQHPEGWAAGLRYAGFLLNEQKLEEAKPILVEIANASAKNPILYTQANLALAGVHEDLKEYDEALASLEKLLKDGATELKPRLLLAKGRVLVAKGQKAEAQAVFDSLLKDHASSPEAERARGMKALSL